MTIHPDVFYVLGTGSTEYSKSMNAALSNYAGFAYPASKLRKFIAVEDLFTIILHDGDIVKYTAGHPDHFKRWLLENNVADIRNEDGWVETED
ncbi:hypothetical protein [Dyadobacter sp. 32]|uniref:hypothetical protein n=1 Tax=Dyadobacter sp. 32 TaxID=538966 RepID=UPI0011ECFA1B